MEGVKTLLEEENIISLRTAFVFDNGDIVSFQLMPVWMGSSIPGAIPKPRDFSWTSQDFTWLYRHMRSAVDEEKLMQGYPPIVQQDVKPILFEKPPEFRLLWTDSGHSVALYLNDEPWAFVDEQTHKGYSKGVLLPRKKFFQPVGNQWDEVLFENIFGVK